MCQMKAMPSHLMVLDLDPQPGVDPASSPELPKFERQLAERPAIAFHYRTKSNGLRVGVSYEERVPYENVLDANTLKSIARRFERGFAVPTSILKICEHGSLCSLFQAVPLNWETVWTSNCVIPLKKIRPAGPTMIPNIDRRQGYIVGTILEAFLDEHGLLG
jgi:hypothetical protein